MSTTMELALATRAGMEHTYFEIPGPGGKYNSELKAEICAVGLRDYVDVGQEVVEITLVASSRVSAQSFDIRDTGHLGDIGVYLDSDLRRWLRETYRAGCRYLRVEIGR